MIRIILVIVGLVLLGFVLFFVRRWIKRIFMSVFLANAATMITLSVATVINFVTLGYENVYIPLFAAGITLALLIKSFRSLPPNHFGEPRIFGWRAPWWMTVRVGWCLWPGGVEAFSVERLPFSGKATFFEKEDLQLSEPWHMECTTDYRITDGGIFGRIKFLKVRNFAGNASQFMSSKLAKIGGVSTREAFKGSLKEVEDYLRCAIMLEKPLHPQDLEHNTSDGPSPVLLWYKTNRLKVKENLEEKKASSKLSQFEIDYGIRVEIFRLEDPEYTEKTAKDLEEKRQQKARADAAKSQLELAKDFQGLGLPPEEAVDAAQVAVLGTRKEIHAIRGGGAVPLLNLGGGTAFPGGRGGSGRQNKGDKE